MPSQSMGPRLPGVDAARGIALLGMVAVHVGPPLTADGAPSPLHLAFAGLASVLFVMLAGVGLALLTGGAGGAGGLDSTRRPALRRQIARRAGLLFVLGLACALPGAPVAVILCHYGLLFLLALPALGVRPRVLLPVAVGWALAGPVLVFALSAAGQALLGRDAFLLEARLWVSPGVDHLFLTPLLTLTDLLLTGYYPVLSWAGFLLLGLALGRLPLGRPRVAGALLGLGTAAWAGASLMGSALRNDTGVLTRISAATGVDPAELSLTLLTGEHRLAWLVPDPLWLAMVAPHSGSVLEAGRAAGWAVAVLGGCLLVLPPRGPASGAAARGAAALGRLALPLEGAGRLTLSLYVGHLVLIAVLTGAGVMPEGAAAVAVFWALCLGAGLVARLTGRRGPLEAGVAQLARGG